MKNTGRAYEALTEQVFTRLLALTDVVAKVERDVVLQGRSTSHQIDVTFEFTAGPISYRTIVQCKDWATPVKQEQVLAFRSVLDDIPGQPRGIVVSRSGFQEGARGVAEHHGIKLYELREPRDEDWNGLVRAIKVSIKLRLPEFADVRLLMNEDAIRSEVAARGIPAINLRFQGHSRDVPIFTPSGERCDLGNLLSKLAPRDGKGPVRVRHEFDDGAYALVPGSPIPRLALKAIEATITVAEALEELTVSLDHLIAYCFRDVLDGSVQFLGSDGGPLPRRDAPSDRPEEP